MLIHFSGDDDASFARLLSQMEANIRNADFYNDVLERRGKAVGLAAPYAPLRLDPARYRSDPYARLVTPKPARSKMWALTYDRYQPFEGFLCQDIQTDPRNFYAEKTSFGYFAEPFRYLAAKQNGVTWMSVTPHEIETMRGPIAQAHGSVVALGLGLGYFPFMASLRSEVKSVLAIERDPSDIALFHERLLPFFPHPEKISVRQMDAFAFLKEGEPFDFLFADLWHQAADGLPLYLRLKKFERNHPQAVFSYWIEPSLLALLRRALIILMDEEKRGAKDESYLKAITPSDELINELHFALKGQVISSFGEAMAFLSDGSLRALAGALNPSPKDR
jgi:hypothetical protein